jgi:4-amino-4-deoxy-L-arabinose transferase-like glycosyltransferase
MTSISKRTAAPLAVVLVALVVRLVAVSLWGGYDLRDTFDQHEYFALAQNVRLHGSFSYGEAHHRWGERGTLDSPGPYEPAAARAPLYPFMIAALWWRQAPPLLEVRVAQAALGAATALLVYLIALQMFGLGPALIAGLAMALAPVSAHMAAILLSETLFTFLLTASLWCWTRKKGVLAGILLGAATLARAVTLPLVGALLLLGCLWKVNRGLHFKIAIAAVCVIAPWTIRNAITQHAFIPVASIGFGANVLLGTIDVPYGSGNEFMTFNEDKDFTDTIRTSPTVYEAERRMSALAIERIRAAPIHWLWVRVKQSPRFWIGTGSIVSSQPVVRYGFIAGSVAFWGLAIWGMFLARGRWRELYPIVFFPTLLAMAHFIGSGDERYSLGLVPMATIFAAFAAYSLYCRRVRP